MEPAANLLFTSFLRLSSDAFLFPFALRHYACAAIGNLEAILVPHACTKTIEHHGYISCFNKVPSVGIEQLVGKKERHFEHRERFWQTMGL